MDCPYCGNRNFEFAQRCSSCGRDLGYPNVHASQKREEVAALNSRWEAVHQRAIQRGTETVLNLFEQELRKSKAVLCRRLGTANWLISSDNIHLGSFWLEVDAGIRTPEDNEFDRARAAVDATFFPYYHQHIRFAALSLNGLGPLAYGACSIVLRDSYISHRASVSEENTLVFCRRHGIIVGHAPPVGYRASWDDRHRLAAAKLGDKLEQHMGVNDFPTILLQQAKGTDEVDFVEVHIFGSLNQMSIERMVIPKDELSTPENQILVEGIRAKLGVERVVCV